MPGAYKKLWQTPVTVIVVPLVLCLTAALVYYRFYYKHPEDVVASAYARISLAPSGLVIVDRVVTPAELQRGTVGETLLCTDTDLYYEGVYVVGADGRATRVLIPPKGTIIRVAAEGARHAFQKEI